MTKILKTKTIDIEYDDESQQEAEKLKELIDNNHQIFHDLFLGLNTISFNSSNNTATLNITSIADLKEQLRERVPAFMDDTIPQIEAANNGQAEIIYLKFLLLDKFGTVKKYAPEFADNPEYQMYVNSIFSLVAALYYNTKNTPEKIVDFVFDMPDEEKHKIMHWLNERNRYNLLNNLLAEQYQIIIQAEDEEEARDPFLKRNLDVILDVIQTDFINSQIYLYEDISKDIPTLTKDRLDELCIEFFKKIDPSGKWLEKYNEMKTERIVCGQVEPGIAVEWCCVPYGDSFVIVAPLTGTIRDFRNLIHEFSHYIPLETLENGEGIHPSVDEYPSILLESEAIKFLAEKGYPKEAVEALRIERQVWTQENIMDATPVLRYLAKFLRNGPITFEQEQAQVLTYLAQYEKEQDEELLGIINKYIKSDYDSLATTIDAQNSFLLQFPDYTVKAYPYIISKYLAKKTEERIQEDPTLIYSVVDITNNLKNETPESIITKLGLSVGILIPTDKPKELVKTDNTKTEN